MKDVGIFFWGFLTPKTGNELKNIIIFEFDMTENFVCNTCKIAAGASIKGGGAGGAIAPHILSK